MRILVPPWRSECSRISDTALTNFVPNSNGASLIGLDWGTSSLRAYLIDLRGAVLDMQHRPWGIMQLPPGDRMLGFEHALQDTCGTWLTANPTLPILACGMVGSAQGWHEAPYLEIPTSLKQLANHLTRFERHCGQLLHLVPGLLQRGALPNVMRGEETQVLGVLSQRSPTCDDLWIGLPGTHSKWVMVTASNIMRFDTFMTGEVFSTLRQHTILGRTMQAVTENHGNDDAAFVRGLQVAKSEDAGLGVLSHIFSTRTLGLTGQLPASSQADYLSGVLVGHEIAALTKHYRRHPSHIVLCGEPDLCRRYALALQHYDLPVPDTAEQATVQGLWQIAVAAGLVTTSPNI
jgi:2-dehydro-3-deoxygalactonokinase